MNDSGQYVVQMGDYDQNTYIIQDSNGVQYQSGDIIGGELADGTNIVTEPRWIPGGGRGGKVMGNQQFVNGDLVQVSGTGLNLNTRYTPSSIVLNTSTGNQFEQDNLRIASAVSGSGARGRPRGRKPSRGNFPVVPIDMVRQLGIEQQVILQPTVPVATKNKYTMTKPIVHEKAIQTSESETQTNVDSGVNTEPKVIYRPVFIPMPVPVFIPAPVFMKLKEKQAAIPVVSEQPEVDEPTEVVKEVKAAEISNKRNRPESSTWETVPKHRKLDNEITTKSLSENQTVTQDNVTQATEVAKKDPVAPSADSYKLKCIYGMNAWRHWSKSKDILQMTNEEINESLSLFVKQVTKPNNELYVPDSIMYLCLGIQLFLIENKKIAEGEKCVSLFTDPQFAEFQSSLDSILSGFKPILNENQTLLCRIEEDHYWEAKQLGCYDARVLLFSVCYLLTSVLKIRSSEQLTALKHSQFEITDTEVSFRESSDAVESISLCKKNADDDKGRDFYSIFKLYTDKCNTLPDRPDQFFVTPAAQEKATEESDVIQFTDQPLDQNYLTKMYNQIVIVKEVQENLLNSSTAAAAAATTATTTTDINTNDC